MHFWSTSGVAPGQSTNLNPSTAILLSSAPFAGATSARCTSSQVRFYQRHPTQDLISVKRAALRPAARSIDVIALSLSPEKRVPHHRGDHLKDTFFYATRHSRESKHKCSRVRGWSWLIHVTG